jgi:hypothetical protein
MTDIMSYQYPPPPNGADMDMPQSGYLPSYSSSGMDPDSSIPSRERSELRRSISTPVVGPSQGHPQQPTTPQQAGAAALDAAAERRRNKLGYHRTSVACGKYPTSIPLSGGLGANARCRPLSSTKDQVCPVAKRCSGTLHKLHTPEKGMQLLPRGPAAACGGHEAEVGIAIIRRPKAPLCLFVAGHAARHPIRHSRPAALSSTGDAVHPEHGSADEALRKRHPPF